MRKVGVFPAVLLLFAPVTPTLWPQTTELRDARPGEEITTMQSPGLELRLKGPGGTENARAVDPEGAFVLNPFPYGYRDVRPPGTPQGVRGVAASDTEVLVTFEASSDNVRVLGYDVYCDGARVGSTEIETYSDTGLAPMSTSPGRPCARQLVSSADGTKLVAASYGGQIYTSTDSGANWTAGITAAWSSLASSADGTKLAATTVFGQVCTSVDSGSTWGDWTTLVGGDVYKGLLSVASSAAGDRLVVTVSNRPIYTWNDTAQEPAGNLSGAQFSAIELQYVGGDTFMQLSSTGTITFE